MTGQNPRPDEEFVDCGTIAGAPEQWTPATQKNPLQPLGPIVGYLKK